MSAAASTATTLPVGHVFDIVFPMFTPRISIDSDTELTFDIVEGDPGFKGFKETVAYQVVNLRPGLFLVTWQEKSKATVVHVEDFATGVVHTNFTMPDGTFYRATGEMRAVAG